MKLGDAISKVAEPVARAMNLPCIDQETGKTRPESACGKRKQWLNQFSDSVYDAFWPNTKPERKE